jgi:hypothetical protein
MSSSTLSQASDDSSEYTSRYDKDSPLVQSLLTICALPYCADSPIFFKNVPSDNQPHPLKGMPDNAEYFVRNTAPLVMTFPAEIDVHGKYNRLAPYFNLQSDSVRFQYRTSIFQGTHFLCVDRTQ